MTEIKHLRGRQQKLAEFGWSPQEATWVALVCLHSGLFTRAQFCAYFGSGGAPAWAKQATRFVQALLSKKLAVEEPLDGLPTTTRPCRISNKAIYRALEVPNVRHRRGASASVLFRRLLSLDYVLDHPHHAWLPTEQEKVAALEALEIPNQIFPRRRYHGRAGDQIRHFPLKLPIALDDHVATFVYCDPGRDSDKELLSWGADHARLWTALRQRKHEVHVVAVARDHTREQRAKKILQRWTRPGDGAEFQPLSLEERENLRGIEQAVKTTNLRYFDQYGGFAKAMDYRQMLLDRPEAPTPKNRIRIDQGKSWRSPRVPAEEEPATGP